MDNNNNEIWMPLNNYIGIEVSSLGRIKRLPIFKKEEIILSTFPKDRDGYYRCGVTTLDGKHLSKPVHRLVAEAFLDNPENKPCVNHIDNDRTNNCVENLEWVTQKENVYHSYLYGNRKKCKTVPRNTLLTDYQISQIDVLRKQYTVAQIAKLFNIEYQSLKNIIHKKKQREKLDNQQPSNYNTIYN